MLFNSLHFLVFFAWVSAGYFLIGTTKGRQWWLLAASAWFYLQFVPVYLLLLLFIISLDYVVALRMARAEGRARKAWLAVSLVSNLGILAAFKYVDFFAEVGQWLAQGLGGGWQAPHLGWVLPIGLSFHTFQAMSYTIEVYRKQQPPERDWAVFALYVLFYPQLVAGPIERPQRLLGQLHQFQQPSVLALRAGLWLMAVGFFKKVVIADRLALAVDAAYAHPDAYSAAALWLANIGYAFQIYCDFSGYSDIAIGAAATMGYQLMPNFAAPYLAVSLREFWQRWHISLSSWFRDYLYIPLGGNRAGPWRQSFNLLLVFALSGLWHGANVTFAIWGLWHGAGMLVQRVLGRFAPANWLTGLLTFAFVSLGWVWFRAPNVATATAIFRRLLACAEGQSLDMHPNEIFFSLLLIGLLLAYERPNVALRQWLLGRSVWPWAFGLLVLVCYFFGVFGERQFIYFQF